MFSKNPLKHVFVAALKLLKYCCFGLRALSLCIFSHLVLCLSVHVIIIGYIEEDIWVNLQNFLVISFCSLILILSEFVWKRCKYYWSKAVMIRVQIDRFTSKVFSDTKNCVIEFYDPEIMLEIEVFLCENTWFLWCCRKTRLKTVDID